MNRFLAMKAAEYSVYAFAGLVATGSVLATTGTLPDALQDPVANAVHHVGINLPGGADEHRAAAPIAAPVQRSEGGDKGSGRAFKAPKSDATYERSRAPSSRRYYQEDYQQDDDDYYYYGEYYLPEEEEEDDDQVYFVPQEDSGDDGYNPGEPGEPGGRGIPDSGGDGPGESDGTPGEGGPGGDPG